MRKGSDAVEAFLDKIRECDAMDKRGHRRCDGSSSSVRLVPVLQANGDTTGSVYTTVKTASLR